MSYRGLISEQHFQTSLNSNLIFSIAVLLRCHNPPGWPDTKLKYSSIFSKSCPKSNHSSLIWKVVAFHMGQKFHHAFGLLLIETMSPRTFKNSPIWSHCRPRSNFILSLCIYDLYFGLEMIFAVVAISTLRQFYPHQSPITVFKITSLFPYEWDLRWNKNVFMWENINFLSLKPTC